VYISPNPWLSYLHVLRFINLSLFYLWLQQTLNSARIHSLVRGLMASILFIFVISIGQFVTQKSLGINIFHEPEVSVNQVGTAKIQILDQTFMRPYSILPHPNVLGWLGISFIGFILGMQFPNQSVKILVLSQLGYFLFDHMHWSFPIVQYLTVMMFATLKVVTGYSRDVLPRVSIWGLSIASLLVGISFSRLSWGSFIALGVVFVVLYRKMFHVEHFSIKRYLVAISIVPFLFFGSVWRFLQLFQESSLGLRVEYIQRSIEVIQENILQGIGVGNYVSALVEMFIFEIPEWQMEPVHNVILLMFAEIGLIGSIICVCWIYVYKKILQ
jgi:hypothetical protein